MKSFEVNTTFFNKHFTKNHVIVWYRFNVEFLSNRNLAWKLAMTLFNHLKVSPKSIFRVWWRNSMSLRYHQTNIFPMCTLCAYLKMKKILIIISYFLFFNTVVGKFRSNWSAAEQKYNFLQANDLWPCAWHFWTRTGFEIPDIMQNVAG